MSHEKRRLAAIMFTDLVGYTALGQRNESLSLALVEEQRKLLRPIFQRHHGREVKTIGDAFFVEFPSALEAVRCAFDIQRAAREFNISLAEDHRIHLRIGVHLGDVVESLGDISGDAVNVASRIESLAEDGGVCLTRQVYDHVSNKFDLPLVSMGAKSLKNVSMPLEIYKMAMPWDSGETIHTQLDPNRIAVLPFANMSPDPNDWYFADGITEEIISTLATVSGLSVISRTSVMSYKGTSKRVKEIGKELEAGSILEGSFRKAGNKIRITTQLISTSEDKHLWAQSYDRELDDVFKVESDIASSVTDALKIKLLAREKQRIEKTPTKNTQALSLYLKGRYYWNERTKDGIDKAIKYFEAAIKLDPNYAPAYAGLSDCYIISGDYGWAEPKDAFPKAREYALRSIEADSQLAGPHTSLACEYSNYEWKWKEADEEFKKALDLEPNYATGHQWYALYLKTMGRLVEAAAHTYRAAELDPLSRIIAINVASLLIDEGRYAEAIEKANQIIEAHPEHADSAHYLLGQALWYDSRVDEGIEEIRKAENLSVDETGTKPELAFVLGFSGRRDESERLLQELIEASRTFQIPKTSIARVQFALGKYNEAFANLDMACEDRSIAAGHGYLLKEIRYSPLFEAVRKDPRWSAIETRLKLPKL